MTDERIREIARKEVFATEFRLVTEVVEAAIRQALSERDREVVKWAKDNAQTYTHNREYGCVSTADLLAFLEGKP